MSYFNTKQILYGRHDFVYIPERFYLENKEYVSIYGGEYNS